MSDDLEAAGGKSVPEDAAPTREELQRFGRGWTEYLGLNPDEEITYPRSDGSTLTFALGDVALVSPHSIPAFNELGRLIAANGNDHPAVMAQIEVIMGFVRHYRGY